VARVEIGNRNGNSILTNARDNHHRKARLLYTRMGEEGSMPVLMVALMALAAFGIIGFLLGAAVVLEQRKVVKHHSSVKSA
jgi:hypothetical protein